MKITKELMDSVNSYKDGNTESFNQIYTLSYGYLYTCIIHIVKDEEAAMDMLQDTYIQISKSIKQLKESETFLKWAATIANRKCFSYLKKKKDVLLGESEEERKYFEEIADDEELIPESILQDREKQRLMREIIDNLTEMQRLCVIGFYYNEQSLAEIAKELEIPINTVKSHLNRAKGKIKEAVMELDEKRGTRLYGIAPFMLLYFEKEIMSCGVKAMSPELVAVVAGGGAKVGMSSGVGKMIISKVAAAAKVKIAAGAIAVSVVVGGIAATTGGTEQIAPFSQIKTVVQEAFMDEAETVAFATKNTIRDAKPMIITDLNLSKIYQLIASKKYTVEVSGEVNDARLEGKYMSKSSERQLSGQVSVDGDCVDGTILLTKYQLKVGIPELTDEVLIYNYKEEADGYLVDLLEEEGVSMDVVSEILQKIYEQKEIESKGVEISKVYTKQMKTWEWERIEENEIEVDGMLKEAEGYAVTITEENVENLLNAFEDYFSHNYQELMREYGKDFFEVLKDEIKDMEDIYCKFYIYGKQLVTVELQYDNEEINIYFKGGDFRMQNMEIEIDDGNNMTVINLEGKAVGTKETYRLRTEEEVIAELEYDSSNGKYGIEIAPDSDYGTEVQGTINKNKDEYGLRFRVFDGDDTIQGGFAVSGESRLQELSGSEADIFNMSESEFRTLLE